MTLTTIMSKQTIIKPGPGKIAVKTVSNDYRAAGNLWLPESVSNEGHLGIVEAICDDYMTEDGRRIKPDYKVGETVVFGKYSGTEVRIGRETYIILREADILGALESKEVPDAQPG